MKLYIGNLPFSATEAELRELFGQHGTVHEVNLITDRYTGKPRGFGFIEMDDAEATAAISALDGTEMNGRNLKVNQARARSDSREGRNLEQAIGFTRKAAILDTNDWRIKDNLGMYHLLSNNLDSAKFWFDLARILKSDHPELDARMAQVEEALRERARQESLTVADTLKLE